MGEVGFGGDFWIPAPSAVLRTGFAGMTGWGVGDFLVGVRLGAWVEKSPLIPLYKGGDRRLVGRSVWWDEGWYWRGFVDSRFRGNDGWGRGGGFWLGGGIEWPG